MKESKEKNIERKECNIIHTCGRYFSRDEEGNLIKLEEQEKTTDCGVVNWFLDVCRSDVRECLKCSNIVIALKGSPWMESFYQNICTSFALNYCKPGIYEATIEDCIIDFNDEHCGITYFFRPDIPEEAKKKEFDDLTFPSFFYSRGNKEAKNSIERLKNKFGFNDDDYFDPMILLDKKVHIVIDDYENINRDNKDYIETDILIDILP